MTIHCGDDKTRVVINIVRFALWRKNSNNGVFSVLEVIKIYVLNYIMSFDLKYANMIIESVFSFV